jgi:hypothetical protein
MWQGDYRRHGGFEPTIWNEGKLGKVPELSERLDGALVRSKWFRAGQKRAIKGM